MYRLCIYGYLCRFEYSTTAKVLGTGCADLWGHLPGTIASNGAVVRQLYSYAFYTVLIAVRDVPLNQTSDSVNNSMFEWKANVFTLFINCFIVCTCNFILVTYL